MIKKIHLNILRQLICILIIPTFFSVRDQTNEKISRKIFNIRQRLKLYSILLAFLIIKL